MRIIQVGNRKGGVRKSTTAVNLAYELAEMGKRTLLVDLDSQGNATDFVRQGRTEFYVGDVLLDRKLDPMQAIYPAVLGGKEHSTLFVMPGRSGDAMTKLDMALFSENAREQRLSRALNKIKGQFDFVIIDTSPGTSVLALNGVMAATEYLIPTEYGKHSRDGIEIFLDHICDVLDMDEDDLNFRILPAAIDTRELKAKEQNEQFLEGRFPGRVTKTVIAARTIYKVAAEKLLPIRMAAPSHQVALQYKQLAQEILK